MENTSLNKTRMIEYFRHVLELEGNVYTATQMITQLRSKADSLVNHNEYIPEPRIYTARDAIDMGKDLVKKIASSLLLWFVGLCIIILCQMVIADSLSDLPVIIFTVVMFIYCIVSICHLEYVKNKKIKDYNISRNNKLELQNEKNAMELKQKQILETKINTINASLRRTYELRNQLYNLENIYIYPKYRNIVAIAQFLEYYESGRRDRLEGVNGAYDLFETELRQNIIIDSLARIEKGIDNIYQNQRALYNELQSTNSLITSMRQELNQLSHNFNEVKINSYITAYNTMAVAKNLDAENYMKVHYQNLPYGPV